MSNELPCSRYGIFLRVEGGDLPLKTLEYRQVGDVIDNEGSNFLKRSFEALTKSVGFVEITTVNDVKATAVLCH